MHVPMKEPLEGNFFPYSKPLFNLMKKESLWSLLRIWSADADACTEKESQGRNRDREKSYTNPTTRKALISYCCLDKVFVSFSASSCLCRCFFLKKRSFGRRGSFVELIFHLPPLFFLFSFLSVYEAASSGLKLVRIPIPTYYRTHPLLLPRSGLYVLCSFSPCSPVQSSSLACRPCMLWSLDDQIWVKCLLKRLRKQTKQQSKRRPFSCWF